MKRFVALVSSRKYRTKFKFGHYDMKECSPVSLMKCAIALFIGLHLITDP